MTTPSVAGSPPPSLLASIRPRQLARNTSANWLSYAITAAVGLVLTPVIISRLGAPTYGLWLLVLQIASYIGLVDGGMRNGVMKYTAQGKASDGEAGLAPIVTTALTVTAAVGAVIGLASGAFAPALLRWFEASGRPEHSAALVLVLVAAAVALPGSVASAALYGLQRFDLAASAAIAGQSVRALGTLATLGLGAGILGLGGAQLAGTLTSCALALFLLQREAGGSAIRRGAASRQMAARLASFGVVSAASSIGGTLAYGTGNVVIGMTRSPTEVAHFGLAVNVTALFWGVASGFTGTFTPLSSETAIRGGASQVGAQYVFGTRIALYLFLPILLVLVLDGPQLLSAWVGPAVGQPAGHVLQVLALAQVFALGSSVAVSVALGVGMRRVIAAISVLEGTLGLTLSIFAVRSGGAMGVGLAMLATAALVHGLVWPACVARWLRTPVFALWLQSWAPILAPVLCALTVHFLAGFAAPTQGLPLRTLRLTAVTAVYWFVGFFTCFSRAERARFWRAILAAASQQKAP